MATQLRGITSGIDESRDSQCEHRQVTNSPATFAMGNLSIEIQAQSDLGFAFQKRVQHALAPGSASGELRLHFPAQLSERSGRSTCNVLLSPDGARLKRYGILADLHLLPSQLSLDVTYIGAQPLRGWKTELARCRSRCHLTPLEHSEYEIASDLFTWTSQLAQTRVRQSYIHASAMRFGDRTLALMGWRGVCKTSVQLALCLAEGWEYISDDLAAINEDRLIFRTPHPVNLFGFNIEQNALTRERVFSSRTLLDRLCASYKMRRYSPAHVRRIIPAEHIYKTVPKGHGCHLTDALYLERGSNESVALSMISGEELARRMAAIVATEMGSYSVLRQQMEILGDYRLPEEKLMQARAERILTVAFQGLLIPVLHLPTNFAPEHIASEVAGLFRRGQTSLLRQTARLAA